MDDGTELENTVLELVEEVLREPQTTLETLNVEIDRLLSRYTVLCALRDALTPDEEPQPEQPEPASIAVASAAAATAPERSNESLIIDYLKANGPQTASDIGKAIGIHYVTVGHVVKRSNLLVRDGGLIQLRS